MDSKIDSAVYVKMRSWNFQYTFFLCSYYKTTLAVPGRRVNCAADIYSFGIVALEVISSFFIALYLN